MARKMDYFASGNDEAVATSNVAIPSSWGRYTQSRLAARREESMDIKKPERRFAMLHGLKSSVQNHILPRASVMSMSLPSTPTAEVETEVGAARDYPSTLSSQPSSLGTQPSGVDWRPARQGTTHPQLVRDGDVQN